MGKTTSRLPDAGGKTHGLMAEPENCSRLRSQAGFLLYTKWAGLKHVRSAIAAQIHKPPAHLHRVTRGRCGEDSPVHRHQ